MKYIRVLSAAAVFLAAGGQAAAHAQARGQEQQDDRRRKQDDKDKKPDARVSPQEQQQRVQQEQHRTEAYRQHLDQQVRVAQQQATELQEQKRVAQARAQEQYAATLRIQQERLRTERDYARDPYVSTPHTYRYVVGGATRQTNQFGADVLRAAVNNGYQQGYRAGEADHQDRRRSSYRTSFGYQDANFGYGGNYVDQADYNYYFREGFRRGYDDGYNRRSQYGTSTNGTPAILGTLMLSILGLQAIR
jgi:hypothetical protein